MIEISNTDQASDPSIEKTSMQGQVANATRAKKDEDPEVEISESTYKTTHTAVRKARRFAVQGIYEWLMTDRRFEQNGHPEWKANSPHDIAARTRATNAMHTVHIGYYHEMMRAIPQQIEELDELISAQLDRDIKRLDAIEHAILLIGTYELKHSLHIPYKIVFDESMKLNTHFGGTDAHKLINAVLHRIAKKVRVTETKSDKDDVVQVEAGKAETDSLEDTEVLNKKESTPNLVAESTDDVESTTESPQLN